MLFVSGLLLILQLSWGQSSSPVVDPDKFTVCGITINSDDEKKVFASQIAKLPEKFNPIVELTDFGDDDDWFKKACESKIRCDQLVISGHFGGEFFGEKTEKRLSLKELEEAGCSKSCENVLNQPYEVFLFGCNTLSGKDEDHRTPAQYLQVLLNDGIPLSQAEMVVESRYGAVGDSHKNSMQRAFAGEGKQLYGFNSVGPSGKNVKGFLENYFKKSSPVDRLEKLQAKRMLGKVDMANEVLAQSLRKTAFTQCSGGNLEDEGAKKICKLRDSRVSVEDKLDLVVEIFSQENYLTYLPTMNSFFKDHPVSDYTDSQKEKLKLITENETIKREMLGLIGKTKGLGLKLEWVNLAINLGYMDKTKGSSIITAEVEKIFTKPLTLMERDMLCSMDGDDASLVDLRESGIKYKGLGEYETSALSCLKIKDQETILRAIKNMEKTSDQRIQLLTMGLLNSSFKNQGYPTSVPTVVLNKARSYLNGKENAEKSKSLIFFSNFNPQDKDFHAAVRKHLKDEEPWVRESALTAFGQWRPKDLAVQRELLPFLTDTDEWVRLAAVEALVKCEPTDHEMHVVLAEVIKSPNHSQQWKLLALDVLKKNKSKDPDILRPMIEYLTSAEIDSYMKDQVKDHLTELSPLPGDLEQEFRKALGGRP